MYVLIFVFIFEFSAPTWKSVSLWFNEKCRTTFFVFHYVLLHACTLSISIYAVHAASASFCSYFGYKKFYIQKKIRREHQSLSTPRTPCVYTKCTHRVVLVNIVVMQFIHMLVRMSLCLLCQHFIKISNAPFSWSMHNAINVIAQNNVFEVLSWRCIV